MEVCFFLLSIFYGLVYEYSSSAYDSVLTFGGDMDLKLHHCSMRLVRGDSPPFKKAVK